MRNYATNKFKSKYFTCKRYRFLNVMAFLGVIRRRLIKSVDKCESVEILVKLIISISVITHMHISTNILYSLFPRERG